MAEENVVPTITREPLNSCNIDIDEIAEEVMLGPQAEIISKLQFLNERFDLDLGVNKAFSLKPGCYDQLKERIIDRYMRFGMKNSGLSTLFKRIDNNQYVFNYMKRELGRLDTQLSELKRNKCKWQDNSDEAKLSWEFILERLIGAEYSNLFENIALNDLNMVQSYQLYLL